MPEIDSPASVSRDLTCPIVSEMWNIAKSFRDEGDNDAYGVMMVALTVIMTEVTGIPAQEIQNDDMLFWIEWVTTPDTVQ